MEGFLNAPSVRIFVCENQGKKAGMMVLKYSNAVAEIIGIAVPEKLHCRGIGRNSVRRDASPDASAVCAAAVICSRAPHPKISLAVRTTGQLLFYTPGIV